MHAVRHPAVAGSFYPADPATLRRQIDGFLDEARTSVEADLPAPKAIVAPHAGYVYSGSTAALAYADAERRRDEVRRVVLLGPCHRVATRGLDSTRVRPCVPSSSMNALKSGKSSARVKAPPKLGALIGPGGVPGVFGWVMVSSGSSACADGTIVPRPGPETGSGGLRGCGRRVARARSLRKSGCRSWSAASAWTGAARSRDFLPVSRLARPVKT